jgi:hypothetical protein
MRWSHQKGPTPHLRGSSLSPEHPHRQVPKPILMLLRLSESPLLFLYLHRVASLHESVCAGQRLAMEVHHGVCEEPGGGR